MTYHKSDPTVLIAREGYSGLGGMDRTAAATFCGQKFGVTSKDFQPCVEHYVSGKAGDYQAGASTGGSGSTISQIGGFFGSLLTGAANSYAAAKGAAGAQPIVVSSGPPSWLMPVAIGGIGLVAILMLRKRRLSGPVSNPARRRRRRRRSRRSRR
jgi:hypothetical protein